MHDFWSKPIAMLRSKRSGLSLEEKVKDYKVKDSSLRRRGARGTELNSQEAAIFTTAFPLWTGTHETLVMVITLSTEIRKLTIMHPPSSQKLKLYT
ncbi:hypothetical protein Cadr_000025997 [Camelus dromedarius]|uniref:Uncharacterized protein n=1 Tax=Camelus dromedarius TaxID=9838 RepID=A0A5N4CE66_CAMDR|nr:hypothetical protein Cadr_000025997 [Camelus dromedarius]